MRSVALTIACAGLLLTSCASTQALPALTFEFFTPAGAEDPWNRKIENWQARHELDPAVDEHPANAEDSVLGAAYKDFERDLRRQIASETIGWVQANSRRHYRPDGAVDHWATLGEVIEWDGDDCDGLDLLTFVLLRRVGFGKDEIFRAILVEDGTGQHHMVTLWFENGREDNPFVLDPTGVVTPEMVRLSDVPTWEPIEIFDERAHYAVRPSTRTNLVAAE